MIVSTLDGELEIAEEEPYKIPKISPFEFVNAIHYTKQELIVDDRSEKQYKPFIINKALSFGLDTIIPANEMNSRPHLSRRLQFSFLINTIRPRKRFNKWLKAEKIEDLEAVKRYYNYSTEKALQAMRILTPDHLNTIKKRLYTGGLKNDT